MAAKSKFLFVSFVLLTASKSFCEEKRTSIFPEIEMDAFIHGLANISSVLLKRDISELVYSLAATLTAQGVARQLSKSLKPIFRSEKSSICDKISCKKLAMAMHLSDVIYNPAALETLSEFDIVFSKPRANFLEPSFFVLRSRMEAVAWVVIRGSSSVEDVMTDLRTAAEPFMDGMIHQGILRASSFIFSRIRKHLLKGDRIWLAGHSLGAATAAICTG